VVKGVSQIAVSEPHEVKLLTFPSPGETKESWKAKALVFSDPCSRGILHELDRLAPTRATVLIVGETGTGKELAARHVHEQSGLLGPFVAVNCAALTESLVDAELFGHEMGAYTGATHARAGWFEAAQGGTLFLDEIGDMSPVLQLRLLRVLQERQVVRIGSRKPIPIDVRIIAATNVDLEPAVESRVFRRDLYYRLNVANVKLPALRARPGDILPLAAHFLELYRGQQEHVALTLAAQQALLQHSWPGNIRELENVMQVALIMSNGGVIDAADLRLRGSVTAVTDGAGPVDAADDLTALEQALQRLLRSDRQDLYETVERRLITTAFKYSYRNQVQTARRLGVSRNIVRAQLKRFGLLGAETPDLSDAEESES
jgi:sigma-54-specific transcriptional regulator